MNKSIAALTLLAAASMLPAAAGAQEIPGPQVGQPAPALSAKSLDGRSLSLADFKGKVLVLNFWATWCPPCRLETPDMISAYRKLGKGNVAFLGLDSTEQPPIIQAFIASKGLNYPVALDEAKKTSHAYDVNGIPTTYVIDGQGIVRARFVDVISVKQLASFVEAAKAGRSVVVASAVQRKIDALLSPSRYAYPSDYQGVLNVVKSAVGAVNASNDLIGNADPAKGEVTDYLRTRAEQAAVLSNAVNALSKVAKSQDDRALLYRMQGDLATNSEQWPEAVAAYQKALATNVKAQHDDSLSGLAFAYYEQKNWRATIDAYQQLVAQSASPDPDNYISIGKAYLELNDYQNALAAERKGAALADRIVAKKKNSDNLVGAAHSWLYLGRAYQQAGDNANAHLAFAKTAAYAQQLPKKSSAYARYNELAQEADVSLALSPNGKTTVSLAPWTGADLPGSIASTVKYRLVVASHPGSTVNLKATGLAKGWIASFCTDKICAPMQRAVTLPDSGVKIIEFQLIPSDPKAPKHTSAKVEATAAGGVNITTSAIVASR